MIKNFLLFFFIFVQYFSSAQQTLCDFDATKNVYIGFHSGLLDSTFDNPSTSLINPSNKCSFYVRDSILYDFIRLYPYNKMVDVLPYTSNSFSAPKIKLKVLSKAPVGTLVYVQLGNSLDDNYPSGIHSEFVSITTQQGVWETLTFNYFQSPQGSQVASNDVDKMVILFRPNSLIRDTFYFDDIIGPELINITGTKPEKIIGQGILSTIVEYGGQNLDLNLYFAEPTSVSIQLFDITGNPKISLKEEISGTGIHLIRLNTSDLSSGIYFCELKYNNKSQIKKILIAH
jgi:hypothetical protein